MDLKSLDCAHVSVRLTMYPCVQHVAGPALAPGAFYWGPLEVSRLIFPPSPHSSANIPPINPIYCAHDNGTLHLNTSSLQINSEAPMSNVWFLDKDIPAQR